MPRLASPVLLVLTLLGCSGSKGTVAARAADAATLQSTPVAKPASGPAGAPQGAADSVLAKADAGRIIGSPTAGVWMIIISDFQCPYCKTWHDDAWAAIKAEYVDTGKLRVAYINLPLSMHRNAWPAAQAAMCASVQGKFWPVQDALFRSQKEWEGAADPQPQFEAYAREAGADTAALRSCMASGATRPLIQADIDRAGNAGASSTPTFFVGGRSVVGAQPLAAFREAIEAALAAKPTGK
ncbi:MAG: DsbA family protein [Gemmatimonadetes bacterium]|jgi:protein-disulfide isomerase|nr:DsbA family protein [Gemmatimonadota bacterium]